MHLKYILLTLMKAFLVNRVRYTTIHSFPESLGVDIPDDAKSGP